MLIWHHPARSLTSSVKAVSLLSVITDSKLDDGVGVVPGHALVGEQGLQEGTVHAPLRGSSVEAPRGRCVVTYPHQLGVARQDV